jgi:uncharacterized membrane protein YdjX (TVP38/TMEM64 family)
VNSTKRMVVGAAFLLLLVIAHRSGLHHLITLQTLKDNAQWLHALVQQQYAVAFITYGILFSLVTFFLLPFTILLTLAAGYLFGAIPGAALIIVSATLGTAGSFLVTRYLIGNSIQRLYKEQLASVNKELQQYGAWYIIILELLPTPYLFFDLLAGLTTIPLYTYIWATAVGITPGTVLYTTAGEQLHKIQSMRDILSWPFIILILILVVLTLCSLYVYRRMFPQKNEKH